MIKQCQCIVYTRKKKYNCANTPTDTESKIQINCQQRIQFPTVNYLFKLKGLGLKKKHSIKYIENKIL